MVGLNLKMHRRALFSFYVLVTAYIIQGDITAKATKALNFKKNVANHLCKEIQKVGTSWIMCRKKIKRNNEQNKK